MIVSKEIGSIIILTEISRNRKNSTLLSIICTVVIFCLFFILVLLQLLLHVGKKNPTYYYCYYCYRFSRPFVLQQTTIVNTHSFVCLFIVCLFIIVYLFFYVCERNIQVCCVVILQSKPQRWPSSTRLQPLTDWPCAIVLSPCRHWA